MNDVTYYLWNGMPSKVTFFEGGCHPGGWNSVAEHPTNEIPAGETHVLVQFSHGDGAFWATEEALEEHAERIGPEPGEGMVR